MIFVKTFKGYEDRAQELDDAVNEWSLRTQAAIVSIQSVLAHEPDGRARTGDLLYTVVYKADRPFAD